MDPQQVELITCIIKSMIRKKIQSMNVSDIRMDALVNTIYDMLFKMERDDKNVEIRCFIDDFTVIWVNLFKIKRYIYSRCDFMVNVPSYFPVKNVEKVLKVLFPLIHINVNVCDHLVVNDQKRVNVSLR